MDTKEAKNIMQAQPTLDKQNAEAYKPTNVKNEKEKVLQYHFPNCIRYKIIKSKTYKNGVVKNSLIGLVTNKSGTLKVIKDAGISKETKKELGI